MHVAPQIVVNCCPLLSIVTHCCTLLSIVAHCCTLLSIVAHCYTLLYIVVHCCPIVKLPVIQQPLSNREVMQFQSGGFCPLGTPIHPYMTCSNEFCHWTDTGARFSLISWQSVVGGLGGEMHTTRGAQSWIQRHLMWKVWSVRITVSGRWWCGGKVLKLAKYAATHIASSPVDNGRGMAMAWTCTMVKFGDVIGWYGMYGNVDMPASPEEIEGFFPSDPTGSAKLLKSILPFEPDPVSHCL